MTFDAQAVSGHQLPLDQTREIIREVAERYDVPVQALIGQRRTVEYCVPRHAAYAEVRARRPHLSLTQIGAAFGGRDHQTLMHGIRRHQARLAWADFLLSCTGEYQPDLFAGQAMKAAA